MSDVAFKVAPGKAGNPPMGFASLDTASSDVTIEWTSATSFRIVVTNLPPSGVESLTAGTAIALTGTAANPIVNLAISSDAGNALSVGTDGGLKATFTIAPNSITNAMLRDSAGLSVIGRPANSVGDPADIVATADHYVLRRSGSSIGWGPINLSQANATTGQLPVNKGGTGLSTLTSGSYLTGNGTAAVTLRTPAQVWSDIGPIARATSQIWSATQIFNVGLTANGMISANGGVFGLVSGPVSLYLELTGSSQNLNLNFNNNQVFELAAVSTGTTNLTFTTTNVSRVIYIGYIGTVPGRVVNWPTNVYVFAQGGVQETSFTVPTGVRGVIVLLQMSSTIFYRVT